MVSNCVKQIIVMLTLTLERDFLKDRTYKRFYGFLKIVSVHFDPIIIFYPSEFNSVL